MYSVTACNTEARRKEESENVKKRIADSISQVYEQQKKEETQKVLAEEERMRSEEHRKQQRCNNSILELNDLLGSYRIKGSNSGIGYCNDKSITAEFEDGRATIAFEAIVQLKIVNTTISLKYFYIIAYGKEYCLLITDKKDRNVDVIASLIQEITDCKYNKSVPIIN